MPHHRIHFLLTLLLGWSLALRSQPVTIATARALATGNSVTVRGIVTTGPETGSVRFLQDATAGIAAYPGSGSAPGFETAIEPGDSIEVSGYLTDYNGLLEITPVAAFQVLAKNRPLPQPRAVSIAGWSEALEGQLVQVDCVAFEGGGALFSASGTYTVTGSDGQSGAIYLRSGNALLGTEIPTAPVRLTGVLSQYNAFQLLLRSAADITPASCFHFTAPPAQTNLEPSGFRLSWETNVAGKALVQYGLSPNPATTAFLSTSSANQSIDLAGLQPGSIYWVRVLAIHDQDTAYSAIIPAATKSSSSGQIKIYFNQGLDETATLGQHPDGSTFAEVLAETIARINAAQQTIDVAMYNNNRNDITTALKQAYQRGVRVRYIAAASTDNPALSPAPSFPVLYGNTQALMHNKFMAIDANLPDQAWVMSGSLNWTTSNMSEDFNNTLFIQDQSLARAYELEFNEMWGGTGPAPNAANSRFGSAKTDNTPHQFLIGQTPVECWFSPSDHVTQHLVDAIHTAGTQASFAIFSFTKNEIGNAFIQAHQGGAAVRGIMENINDPGAEIGWLNSNGVPTYPHPAPALLHHKYAVLDAGIPASDPTVVTGSHNWTQTAETSNDENTLVLHDARLAILYQAEFDRRWSETVTSTTEIPSSYLHVFPNPASDVLHLRCPEGMFAGGEISVWDALGRRCLTRTLEHAAHAFDLPVGQLPAGIYFIHLLTDRGTATVSFQTLPH